MLREKKKISFNSIPFEWNRLGKIIPRGGEEDFDSDVTGDPCIVWDEERSCYHMFYFAQHKEYGVEINRNGHAVVDNPIEENIHSWKKLGPVRFSENGKEMDINTHKPWILMDAYVPNKAVKWNGHYWIFTATIKDGVKFIQAAYSDSLDGPWEIDPSLDILPGKENAPDGYHAEVPTAFFFKKEKKILVFYMGYPLERQEYAKSPYGSSSMLAVIDTETKKIEKRGVILPPSSDPSNWSSGYIGGFQIFPATKGWFALLNASPTSPCEVEKNKEMREPAPSLGGFAYTEESFPDKGWKVFPSPLEYIEDIPFDAKQNGEDVNMWRHHLLVLSEKDKAVLLYNSGNYGNEQMFGKIAELNKEINKQEETI